MDREAPYRPWTTAQSAKSATAASLTDDMSRSREMWERGVPWHFNIRGKAAESCAWACYKKSSCTCMWYLYLLCCGTAGWLLVALNLRRTGDPLSNFIHYSHGNHFLAFECI